MGISSINILILSLRLYITLPTIEKNLIHKNNYSFIKTILIKHLVNKYNWRY